MAWRTGCAAPRLGFGSVPGSVAGFRRFRAHGLGGERGPVLARVPEPAVQLVAEPLGIVDGERDKGLAFGREAAVRLYPGRRPPSVESGSRSAGSRSA